MNQKKIVKEYTNGEVTVIWKPEHCNHSSICLLQLPEVFRLNKRPWINMDGASTKEIIEVVQKCPTPALDYFMNEGFEDPTGVKKSESTSENNLDIEILNNGPLIIKGKTTIKMKGKESIQCDNSIALCRCGLSKNQPYCDGAHYGHNFDDNNSKE